jgi:hypothetical protein
VHAALGPTPGGVGPDSDEGRCWEAEDLAWIATVDGTSRSASPHVQVQALEALNWQAAHGRPAARGAAQTVVKKIRSLNVVREVGALSSLPFVVLPLEPDGTFSTRQDAFFRSEATRFLKRYPTAAAAVDRLVAISRAAEQCGAVFEPHRFLWSLCETSPTLALDVASEALRRNEPCLQPVTGMLIAAGLRVEPAKAGRLATRVLRCGVKPAVLSLAVPFCSGPVWQVAPRLARRVASALLSHADPEIRNRALRHLACIEAVPRSARLGLALSVRLDLDSRLADAFSSVFAARRDLAISTLSPREREQVLARLLQAPDLDGHWTEALLAQFVAGDCGTLVRFFLDRLRHDGGEDYRALPLGFDHHLRAALADGAGAEHLPAIWRYASAARARVGRVAVMFWTMAGASDRALDFLESRARRCGAPGLALIAELLDRGPDGVILHRPNLVQLLFDRAYGCRSDVGRRIEFALSRCAMPRHVTANMGQPAPVHEAARDAARAAMAQLKQSSRAWRFFKEIERNCVREIEEHLMVSEEMLA